LLSVIASTVCMVEEGADVDYVRPSLNAIQQPDKLRDLPALFDVQPVPPETLVTATTGTTDDVDGATAGK
jgi:hypothetical protein